MLGAGKKIPGNRESSGSEPQKSQGRLSEGHQGGGIV